MSDELRERIAEVLRENAVSEAFHSTLHPWRCEYPERYGSYTCFEELVDDLVKVMEER